MLEAETKRRLYELFAGKPCTRCGQPAARLRNDRFFCHGCVLVNRRPTGPQGRRITCPTRD